MKPICNEVRQLIIKAKIDGRSNKEIAYFFNVGIDTITRLWRLFKQTESLEPKPYTGRPSRLTDDMIASIDTQIQTHPDATLVTIIEELDLPIGKSQLQKVLVKRGYSLKKNTTSQSTAKGRCS